MTALRGVAVGRKESGAEFRGHFGRLTVVEDEAVVESIRVNAGSSLRNGGRFNGGGRTSAPEGILRFLAAQHPESGGTVSGSVAQSVGLVRRIPLGPVTGRDVYDGGVFDVGTLPDRLNAHRIHLDKVLSTLNQ